MKHTWPVEVKRALQRRMHAAKSAGKEVPTMEWLEKRIIDCKGRCEHCGVELKLDKSQGHEQCLSLHHDLMLGMMIVCLDCNIKARDTFAPEARDKHFEKLHEIVQTFKRTGGVWRKPSFTVLEVR